MEIWKPCPFDERYQVSNLGRVKGLKGQILKGSNVGKGYRGVMISGVMYAVHTMVALLFVPNPKNLPEVNHIDEVKKNNKATNLEWCDRLHNNLHSLGKNFKVISPIGVKYHGIGLSKFAREHGLNERAFAMMVSGKRKQYKGWRKA